MPTKPRLYNVLQYNDCLLETVPYLSIGQRKALFPNKNIFVHTNQSLSFSSIARTIIALTVATPMTLPSVTSHRITNGSRTVPQVCTNPPQRGNFAVGTRILTTTTIAPAITIIRLIPTAITMTLATMVTMMRYLSRRGLV